MTVIFPPEKIIKPYYVKRLHIIPKIIYIKIVKGGRFSVTQFFFTFFIYEIILISTTIPKLASWCAAEFVHKIGTAIPDRDCSGPTTAVVEPMKTDLP